MDIESGLSDDDKPTRDKASMLSFQLARERSRASPRLANSTQRRREGRAGSRFLGCDISPHVLQRLGVLLQRRRDRAQFAQEDDGSIQESEEIGFVDEFAKVRSIRGCEDEHVAKLTAQVSNSPCIFADAAKSYRRKEDRDKSTYA